MEKADALGLSTAAILLDFLIGAVAAFDQICSRSFGGAKRRRVHSAGTAALRRRMPLSDNRKRLA